MKSILVATDFSKRSDPAVSRGAVIAKAQNAMLTVVHIVDDDQSERLARAAETAAAALLETLSSSLLNKYGIEPSIIVTRGEPHSEILKTAEKAAAELIIFGSHRRNLARNAFIGTTAERSIRVSSIPVLVARSQDAAPYRRPLVALDLNERDVSPLNISSTLEIFDPEQASVIFGYDVGDYHLLRRAQLTDAELNQYLKQEEQDVRPRALSILNLANVKTAGALLKPAFFNAHDPVLEAVAEIGAVVRPADPLLVVVPGEGELIVEALILNKDIGFVEEGDPVEVKLEAFAFTKYGVIDGVLENVSNDAIEDETLGLVYRASVKLARQSIKVEEREVALGPGMAATAEIKTGSRRIIEYLLSPLLRYRDEALRER